MIKNDKSPFTGNEIQLDSKFRDTVVRSFSGFNCGILPNIDCCMGCEYFLVNKGDITVDCEMAHDFADELMKALMGGKIEA